MGGRLGLGERTLVLKLNNSTASNNRNRWWMISLVQREKIDQCFEIVLCLTVKVETK